MFILLYCCSVLLLVYFVMLNFRSTSVREYNFMYKKLMMFFVRPVYQLISAGIRLAKNRGFHFIIFMNTKAGMVIFSRLLASFKLETMFWFA